MKDAKGNALKFESGAGVQPEMLEGDPGPADFDAFWKAQKARLASVPLKADVKKVEAKKPGFNVYDVKIDCAGGKPVSGYLLIPENAKAKSLGAQVSFHGYGVGGADQQCWSGMIVFDINAHGIKRNRLRGWRPDYVEGLGYYDTATMGKRIKCPTTITAGLGDYVCPPPGVALLYNTIKAPKSSNTRRDPLTATIPPNPKKQTLRGK